MRPADSARSQIWLLLGDKAGDNAQLRALAAGLNLPVAEKPLTFNRLYRIPNVLMGATVSSIAAGRDALRPPWPDLILASGRRSVPVARWIRQQNSGRTKLVHLGRTWAPLDWFDLVVAMPQYRVPAAPNVMHAGLPLNRIAAQRLASEAERWRAMLADLAPPYVCVLLGGPARPLQFGVAEARAIAEASNALARRHAASILAVSSRRTPPGAVAAFTAALDVPYRAHQWSPAGTDNPYAAFLALADWIVVSGDSASMLAEACRTGAPVIAAPLPLATTFRAGLGRLAHAAMPSVLTHALQRRGLLIASRDMPGLLKELARRGHIALIGAPQTVTRPPPDDLPEIVRRVLALLPTSER